MFAVAVLGLLLHPALNTAAGTRSAQPGISVPAGGDLQAALNAARPGDVIELPAGATFTGNFLLPNKSGAQWIVIRSSAQERLPASGSRVSPGDGNLMPRIVSPNTSPAISTAAGAHHYQIIGIETTTSSPVNINLIRLEAPGQVAVDQVPTDIVFDRCYIHGTLTGNIRRGIVLNGVRLSVTGSYLSDFHERNADSQAIAGWNGPGPFKIVNNHLEAAGENVMFGGADPAIRDLVPSDIDIRDNHFFKPLSWRKGDPSYAGAEWSVKNLLELKNARRVLVQGNVLENIWLADQAGFAVQLTVRNQYGRAPWSTIEDVTFIRNIVRHAGSGISILGTDDPNPSQTMKRVLIRDNLFEDVSGAGWGGHGRLFQILDYRAGTTDVVIDHNTAFQDGPVLFAEGKPHAGFVYRNNLSPKGSYGVFGSGVGEGLAAVRTYFPGAVFLMNVMVGATPSLYPPNNSFPASLDKVGFVDLAGGNYRLAASSPYKKAGTDGRDIGADIDALPATSGRR